MKKDRWLYLFMLTGATLMAGCSNDNKPAGISVPVSKKPVVMDPFRFHKLVEVSPGQDYDVLSWGRGSTSVGSFMILHSDSAASKYTTTTGDLDGSIVDVYNSDMDLDGNPEIIIQTKGQDTTNYTSIYAFEFNNSKANKLDFPKLTKSQRQGYRGNDNFYIKDGKLLREFSVYEGTGKDAKATAQKRQLEYGLRNNTFTVKQLSKDSTAITAVKPVTSTPVKEVEPKKSRSSNKKTKKHNKEKKHKKRHRRRHHSDEG